MLRPRGSHAGPACSLAWDHVCIVLIPAGQPSLNVEANLGHRFFCAHVPYPTSLADQAPPMPPPAYRHFDLVASYFAETLQELGVAKEVVDEAAAVVQ